MIVQFGVGWRGGVILVWEVCWGRVLVGRVVSWLGYRWGVICSRLYDVASDTSITVTT